MSEQIIKLIDGAAPIILTALVAYWPQYTKSMKDRGGWWAVAGTALMVVGHVVYRAYM